MTSPFDPDRRITSWLDERAPAREPDGLLRQVLTETSRTARRPSWIIPERWLPMSLFLNPQAAARATAAVLAVMLALGTGAAFALAAPAPTVLPSPSPRPDASMEASPTLLPSPSPTPSSPVTARTGLIAFDTYSGTRNDTVSDIWVMNPDGTDARPLVTGPAHSRKPLWSPDGTRIAYLARDPGLPIETEALTVANADGSDPTVIAQLDGYQTDMGTIRWSPDGTMFALDRVLLSSSVGIRIIDSRSGQTLLEHDGSGPTWSPDNSHLAFVDSKGLEIMDLHGTVERTLVKTTKGSSRHFPARPSDPAWSPDGTMIAYGTAGFMRLNVNIRVVDIASGAVHETSGHAGAVVGAPQWSPDGTRVMYGLGRTQRRVVISDPAGSTRVRLDIRSWHATWSPDGTSILYWDAQDAPGGQLFVIDASGEGTPQPIVIAAPHPDDIGQGSWRRLGP